MTIWQHCSYPKICSILMIIVLVKVTIIYYTSSDYFQYKYKHTNQPEYRINNKNTKYKTENNKFKTEKNETLSFAGHIQNLQKMIPSLVHDQSLSKTVVQHLDALKKSIVDQSGSTLDKILGGLKKKSKWHELPDKFERMNENPIYKPFGIKKPIKREKINVIFIVSTAPARRDRRMAIRETWWSDCKSNNRVSIKCVFLTDQKDKSTQEWKDLADENDQYEDMYFQNLKGGHDFGKRFLYHLVWAKQNFDFDYFLRLDDDYFVCMDRFLLEVPMPPRSQYHWGWVHCQNNIVRPEESIILLSKDIIELFLGQDIDKMLCNRWGDQMIGVWKNELNLPTFYHHDVRLHHDPPASQVHHFQTDQNICTNYIGVHGAYPVQMRTLWKNRGPSVYPKDANFDAYSHHCGLPNNMEWMSFDPFWRVEPKLCKTDPFWGGSSGSTYIGRQGT